MKKNEDEKPINEKIEDALDQGVYKAQQALYGERKSLNEDIPATMEGPNGYRKVNKFATRRNIGRWIVKNFKWVLISLGIVTFITALIVIIK